AILMPYVLKANRSEIELRMDRLTSYMSLAESGFDGFWNWVLALREEQSIPHNLAAIDIDDSQQETVSRMAVEDPSAGGNPIDFSKEQYRAIFIAAVHGTL
ncbi:MAG: iron-containing alcohol dehydrogenase, partial [Desulfobulbaceae bacterium]|nr:iron-containing alcohol dehydrogenase [Desulfobulbaceae bacterium]